MKLKHYVSDYPQHKRAHSAALRVPMVIPLKGDGAGAILRNRGQDRDPWLSALHNWKPLTHDDLRARLVAARYADWLSARAVR